MANGDDKKKKKKSLTEEAKDLYRGAKKKFKELTSPINLERKGQVPINKGEKEQMRQIEGKNIPSNSKIRSRMKDVNVLASTAKNSKSSYS